MNNNKNLRANETTLLLPQSNRISNRDISPNFSLKEFNSEIFLILQRALPVVFAYILQQAIPLVSLFSLGHIVS
jgi:Na+-driven multidrug efflux pump